MGLWALWMTGKCHFAAVWLHYVVNVIHTFSVIMVPTSYQFLLPPKNSHTHFLIPPNECQSHFFFILVVWIFVPSHPPVRTWDPRATLPWKEDVSKYIHISVCLNLLTSSHTRELIALFDLNYGYLNFLTVPSGINLRSTRSTRSQNNYGPLSNNGTHFICMLI